MKKFGWRVSTFLLFILSLFFHASSFATTPLDTSIAPMLQTVLPGVVNIKAQIKITDLNTLRQLQKQRLQNNPNDNQPLPTSVTSVASGVIVDAANGYILTNAHVISDAQNVAVTLSDGRHFTAKIVGLDKPSDIGLLQIKAKNLTGIPLGNSNDVKVGDFVAAIGSPFGLSQTATSGIVSAIGRNTLGIENYENFIQTDAPINPGNSGGALVNMQGQLVGINTAILAPDRGSIGIGFAIPVSMAKSVMDQLIKYGDVKRGFMGIGAQDLTPDLVNAFNVKISKGAAVTLVLPYSPAQQSGVQVGDIITNINGVDIKNASDVVNTVGFLRVNTKVNINLLRNNKQLTLNVALTDPKVREQAIEKVDPFFYGVGLQNFSALSPVQGKVQGVLVLSIQEDSAAWRSELKPGDIIVSVNQQPVTTIEQLNTLSAKSDKLLLNVLRGGSAIFLVISKEV